MTEASRKRPPRARIIVTGDRNWYASALAEQVLNRLILRYGPGLVIVYGAATGIDRSFA
jgi:hypothetical protein